MSASNILVRRNMYSPGFPTLDTALICAGSADVEPLETQQTQGVQRDKRRGTRVGQYSHPQARDTKGRSDEKQTLQAQSEHDVLVNIGHGGARQGHQMGHIGDTATE